MPCAFVSKRNSKCCPLLAAYSLLTVTVDPTRFAFALILGAAAGPERFAQVCDAYLDREESPASAIVGAVSRQDWNDRMVEEWPLHDWRAVLSCVIAYVEPTPRHSHTRLFIQNYRCFKVRCGR